VDSNVRSRLHSRDGPAQYARYTAVTLYCALDMISSSARYRGLLLPYYRHAFNLFVTQRWDQTITRCAAA